MGTAFDQLAARARACRVCRDHPAGRPLPHHPRPVLSGSAGALILIAGQAPGTRVHASGIPFTDPSGKRLRNWMGIDEATFYNEALVAIVPMALCFPGLDVKGGDLPPRRECAPLWRADIVAALENIELVVAVGMYALKWHLGADCGKTLADTLARWRDHVARTPPLIALPHPSWRNTGWLKRHPYVETEVIVALRARVSSVLAGKT
ncbi:Hypothetical protein VC0266 (sugar utilization related?) [hydrothermal vent metagenome]|uniref:Uracil-DNA glycosylase-like domain-containing protein n=1 Tax=hydrothermal vent metagenome TaxID=652676 RepID=A0A3B0T5E7_9ZZZZ